jgi:hypothetical protein
MGTQTQNPGQQPQQPGRRDRQSEDQRQTKGKDAGNVPRNDDEAIDDSSEEGTREDATGRDSHNR